MDGIESNHLDQNLSTSTSSNRPSATTATADSGPKPSTEQEAAGSSKSKTGRGKNKLATTTGTDQIAPAAHPRRSARISLAAAPEADAASSIGGKKAESDTATKRK